VLDLLVSLEDTWWRLFAGGGIIVFSNKEEDHKHSAGTDSRHGVDLARLQVGLDYRVSRELSVAPYLGASATMFFTEQLGHETTFSNIGSPNVNFFFLGGVMGRFDVFPSKPSEIQLASN